MDIHTESFFREATLRVCGSLNIEEAMGRCFVYLKEFIPMFGMGIQIYESDTNTARNLVSINNGHAERTEQIIPMPKGAWQRSKAMWPRLPEVTIASAEGPFDPNVIRLAWQFPWKEFSCMILRLELDSERLGILGLYTHKKHQYTEKHAGLLKMLHEPFAIATSNYLRYQEVIRLKNMLADDNQFLRKEVLGISDQEIIGHDNGLRPVMQMVRLISTLDTPVLLMGETGVGKEVIANAIHYSSLRKDSPFIKVNCGAIPEGLLDSELFGHEKGSFTGAISQKRGRFERAHGGTIFLDEIGELSAPAQVRLLRVLQEKEIERVGGTRTIKVDARIIAATHRNPEDMVKTGRFREDLMFRINTFPIWIPPLRERKEDIPLLTDYFFKQKAKQLQISPIPILPPKILKKLISLHWPGNVRELENAVERALIKFRGHGNTTAITFEDFGTTAKETLHPSPDRPPQPVGVPLKLEDLTRRHINRVLDMTHGKIFGTGGAAEILDINPSTLRSKMRKLGISFQRKRGETA
jgi:transcriptional regulator with GAF, ATPase, and Fis domain